jgi:4-hydroxy-tetrahydrodipicolinate synthase
MNVEFRGIIPPLVTPFADDQMVDYQALAEEITFVLNCGVHGICVTGSTGEGHTLTEDEIVRVAEVTREVAGTRVPVISGLIPDSTYEAIRVGERLKAAGVDALQITPVHYLFQPAPDGMVQYYREIAESIGLPILIYNVVPWAQIDSTTLGRIMEEVPLVVGVKQSGGNMHTLAQLLRVCPAGRSILTAVDDLLYPSFVMGAHGAISAILTVAPALCVELWNSVGIGDHRAALALHERLLSVWVALDHPDMPTRVKAAIAVQGRKVGAPRRPIPAPTRVLFDEMRKLVAQVGLRPAGAVR